MKKVLNSLLIVALAILTFTSCNNSSDNSDFEADYLKAEQKADSLLSAQKTKIEAYKNQYLPTATADTVSINFYYLKKQIKRGIWYRIDSQPTDNSYTYAVNSAGTGMVEPKVKLKYTAKLLDNTIVEEDADGTSYNLGLPSPVITNAWYISFRPYQVKFNGRDIVLEGLTKDGLKKGSKITVIVPSIYAYGAASKAKIPANSPLVYEFEILEIQ